MKRWTRQSTARLGFALLILACITPWVIQSLRTDEGPFIEIVAANGSGQVITLDQMKHLPVLSREGQYQNQYGNWRDRGIYTGVRLADLVGDRSYTSIDVVADDGYHVVVERSRVEDPELPMILAFSKDGVEVPTWEQGFRVAVLPEDGALSNDDYGVVSAGSYWVMRVAQLILLP